MRTSRSRMLLGLSAASVALVLGVTGCTTAETPTGEQPAAEVDPRSPEQDTITIAGYRQGSVAPFFAAERDGLYAEYGIEMPLTYVESSAAGMAAVLGGDAATAYSSFWGVIDAVQQGIDVVIVAETLRFNPGALTFEALPGSGIETLADLEGATVSVPALNSGHHNRMRQAMLAEGLDPSTVEFVELPYGETTSAIVNGTIDVAGAAGPALTGLQNDYDSTTILDLADGIFAGAAEGGWIMTKAYADANPNAVAAFQCAWTSGIPLVANDDLYVDILVEELGFDRDVAIGEIPKKPNFPEVTDVSKIQEFADVMLELGLIDTPFDVASIIVPTPSNC